ncbi:MAG: hypothetical protein RL701_1289, partial [Pseudomonadota bacterium]
SALGRRTLGTTGRDMLPIARPVDIDADRVHGKSIEDRSGQSRITEVAPPITQRDVRRHGSRDAAMSSVDDVVERMRGRGFIVALFDLTEPDVVNDQQVRSRPCFESARIRTVRKAGVQVIEQIDAASVAHADALFARAQCKGFEDVTFASAALARDHQVVAPAYEI